MLADSETVTEAIKVIEGESSEITSHTTQIETMKNKLAYLEKEKDRIWAAFRISGDEAKFTEEIKQNQTKIEELRRRKADMEHWIEVQKQAIMNIDDIKKACEVVRTNLGELSIENKRFALGALSVRVLIDGDNVKMEGIIPINGAQVSFAKSPYSGISTPHQPVRPLCYLHPSPGRP